MSTLKGSEFKKNAFQKTPIDKKTTEDYEDVQETINQEIEDAKKIDEQMANYYKITVEKLKKINHQPETIISEMKSCANKKYTR